MSKSPKQIIREHKEKINIDYGDCEISINVPAKDEEILGYSFSKVGIKFDGSLDSVEKLQQVVPDALTDEDKRIISLTSYLRSGALIPIWKVSENKIINWEYRLGMPEKDIIEGIFNLLHDTYGVTNIKMSKTNLLIITNYDDVYKIGKLINFNSFIRGKYAWDAFLKWLYAEQPDVSKDI
jgi:hypothetical protein